MADRIDKLIANQEQLRKEIMYVQALQCIVMVAMIFLIFIRRG